MLIHGLHLWNIICNMQNVGNSSQSFTICGTKLLLFTHICKFFVKIGNKILKIGNSFAPNGGGCTRVRERQRAKAGHRHPDGAQKHKPLINKYI